MKQFRFPLDSVLRWRETILEQEEAKLQRLFLEQQRIALAIERTHAEGVAAEQGIREQRVMVSTDLRSLAAFRLALEERRESLMRKKAHQATLIERQRQAVLEAERRVQLLVKLKDRRVLEWQYEAGRETETFAQEAFLGRWNVRKHREADNQIPKLKE
jgi:flagellar export protein FliJ